MVSTKGLCFAIALLCVAMPIIIGHALPSDSTEKIGYEAGNRVNITDDLTNSSEYAATLAAGEVYNYSMLSAFPVTKNNVYSPVKAYAGGTSVIRTEHAAGTIDLSEYTTDTEFEPLGDYEDNFTYTYGGTTYYATIVYWYPSIPSLTFEHVTEGSVTIPGPLPTTITSTNGYASFERVITPNLYAQPEDGSYINHVSSTHDTFNDTTMVTNNNLLGASFIITDPLLAVGTWSCSIQYTDLTTNTNKSVLFGVDGEKWFLGSGDDRVTIGKYKQILLEVEGNKSPGIRITGLVYNADFSASVDGRRMATAFYDLTDADQEAEVYNRIVFYSATANDRMKVYCNSVYLAGNPQPVIYNMGLSPWNYYPDTNISIEFSGAAFYGSSIQLPGVNTSYDVLDGAITVVDVQDIDHNVKLRNMTTFLLYDPETLTYDVQIDGFTIAENVPKASITGYLFNGSWLLDVYIYSITPYTYESMDYDFSKLNVTHNEYCLIGMITAVLAFVACALAGKRSGGKMIYCFMIAALAFAIYFGMIE